jgi:hypothetical protein
MNKITGWLIVGGGKSTELPASSTRSERVELAQDLAYSTGEATIRRVTADGSEMVALYELTSDGRRVRNVPRKGW